jgi:hypothetical protein
MERLLAAGALYLIVIAFILTIKPSFMFTEEGDWKEFGIGRNPKTHTWMPFWLFAVLWALVSYIIVTLLLGIRGSTANVAVPNVSSPEQVQPIPSKSNGQKKTPILDDLVEMEPEDMEIPVKPRRNRRAPPPELEEGYYILNQKATEAAGGIPKYIYIGKGLSE